jgi:parallel beta helix pectate lyase-like protein
VKRLALTLALATGSFLAITGTASAATWNVWPGGNIQRAINHASPGDRIVVHRGTYHTTLSIRKSHLTLIGRHARILPPRHPRGFCARMTPGDVPGICVVGGITSNGNPAGRPVVGTRVRGFRVLHAQGEGIFLFHVARSRITRNVAAFSGGYGIAGFVQHSGAYLWNRSHDNAEPGLYLGDSPRADYVIAHNSAWDNQYGIFIRHSAHGRVHDNKTWGNCVGTFLLDDGEQGGLRSMKLWDNSSWANDKACAADDEGSPPLSGIGALLVGARRTTLFHNDITRNIPGGPSAFSGGLVMISARPFGGLPLRHDRIVRNTITGNQQFDVTYDGSGFDNRFVGNTCNTSQPASIC